VVKIAFTIHPAIAITLNRQNLTSRNNSYRAVFHDSKPPIIKAAQTNAAPGKSSSALLSLHDSPHDAIRHAEARIAADISQLIIQPSKR
jgi:hypothetical protein